MITSVYFSNETVQIVVGQAKGDVLQVHSFYQEPIPEATLINGVITNEAAMTTLLKRLVVTGKLPNRKVDLLVDSSSILVKRAPVPILPQKKLMALAKDEFSEFGGNYKELLYDYSVLKSKSEDGKGGVILCSAMERDFVGSYVEMFRGQGVQLRSIDLALGAKIRLAQFLPELKNRTFVLSVLEGNSVVSSLFTGGKYMLTNRTRLLGERGTAETAVEMTQTISSLIQFNRAQKTEDDLTHAYICGLWDSESQLCNTLSEILRISIQPLPDCSAVDVEQGCTGYRLTNAFYATGNLLRKEGALHG
jgi:Tfp pilus assembly PilM family ATPase